MRANIVPKTIFIFGSINHSNEERLSEDTAKDIKTENSKVTIHGVTLLNLLESSVSELTPESTKISEKNHDHTTPDILLTGAATDVSFTTKVLDGAATTVRNNLIIHFESLRIAEATKRINVKTSGATSNCAKFYEICKGKSHHLRHGGHHKVLVNDRR